MAVDGGSTSASSVIMITNQSVISLGGFSGSDPVMGTQELSNLVEQGKLTYVLVSDRGMGGNEAGGFGGDQSGNASGGPSGGFGGGRAGNASGTGTSRAVGGNASAGPMGTSDNTDLTNWVENNCKNVSSSQWQSSSQGAGSSVDFYNCSVEADA